LKKLLLSQPIVRMFVDRRRLGVQKTSRIAGYSIAADYKSGAGIQQRYKADTAAMTNPVMPVLCGTSFRVNIIIGTKSTPMPHLGKIQEG